MKPTPRKSNLSSRGDVALRAADEEALDNKRVPREGSLLSDPIRSSLGSYRFNLTASAVLEQAKARGMPEAQTRTRRVGEREQRTRILTLNEKMKQGFAGGVVRRRIHDRHKSQGTVAWQAWEHAAEGGSRAPE